MWEAAQFLDESLDHYIIDIDLAGHATDTVQEALVVAARREPVDILRQIADSVGFEDPALTVASIALINGFESIYDLTAWESTAVVHIEPNALDLIFIRDVRIKLLVMPLDTGAGSEMEALRAFGDQFRYLLNDMTEEEAPDTVYVSNTNRHVARLCSAWGEQLNRRVTQASPFQKIDVPGDLKDTVGNLNPSAFMVAVGLGCQRLG